MSGAQFAFWALSALVIFSAVAMITRRNPLVGATWLILCFIGIAGLYAMLDAQFLAIIQVPRPVP